MPPQAAEIDVLVNIGELLHEIADAVERYAESVADTAAQGIAPAVEPADLADLAAAWTQVGHSLAGISGGPALPAHPAQPRPDLASVQANLATVRDIVQKQTE
jgi:hypothetical protein